MHKLTGLDTLILSYFQSWTESIQIETEKTCYWIAWVMSFALTMAASLTINTSVLLAVRTSIWWWLGVGVLPLALFLLGVAGVFIYYNVRHATKPVALITDEARRQSLFNTAGSLLLPLFGVGSLVYYGRPSYEVLCVLLYIITLLLEFCIKYLASCHPLPPEVLQARRQAKALKSFSGSLQPA